MKEHTKQLAHKWIRCGVNEGDVLLLHSNIMGILTQYRRKKIKLLPIDILESFMYALGESGTLILPLFNFTFTEGVPFDIRTTPSEMGVLSECGREHPRSVRTGHPIYSFSVIGKESKMFMAVDNYSGYGEDSVFAMLRELDGKIGVLNLPDQNSMTFYHHVEEMQKVPYRYFKEFKGQYTDWNGDTKEKAYALYVRDIEKGVETHVGPMEDLLWKNGLYHGDELNDDTGLRTIAAREMYTFVSDIIKRGQSEGLLYRVAKNINRIGIGNDVESVGRFTQLDKEEHRLFFGKVFTNEELNDCFLNRFPAPFLAMKYSAKEAVVKSLSHIGYQSINYKNVEIMVNKKGVTKAKVHHLNDKLNIKVSVAQSGDLTSAFAVTEKL